MPGGKQRRDPSSSSSSSAPFASPNLLSRREREPFLLFPVLQPYIRLFIMRRRRRGGIFLRVPFLSLFLLGGDGRERQGGREEGGRKNEAISSQGGAGERGGEEQRREIYANVFPELSTGSRAGGGRVIFAMFNSILKDIAKLLQRARLGYLRKLLFVQSRTKVRMSLRPLFLSHRWRNAPSGPPCLPLSRSAYGSKRRRKRRREKKEEYARTQIETLPGRRRKREERQSHKSGG